MGTIQKIWSAFQGEDEKNTLKEKAVILAQVLLQNISLHTEGFIEMGRASKNSGSNTKEKFISLGTLFIEIASVYLVWVDRFASSVLSKKDKET